MKRHFAKRLSLCILCFLASTHGLARTMVYVSNADDGNIVVYELNISNGELKTEQTVRVGDAVMPLTVSPDKKRLYASIRSGPYSMATFSIDQKNGLLHPLSQIVIPDDICFVSADATGENLISSSYSGSKITINKIAASGEVLADSANVYPTGLNAHATLLDATNRFLFVTNLGSDQIVQLIFNAKTGEARPNEPAAVKTKAGAGPRHLRFSPDNRFVYVLNELDGTVNVYAYDKNKGTLTEKQSVLMAAGPFEEKPSAAEIQISPDGQYVYTSERRTNTLNLFKRNTDTGLLNFVESFSTENKPRSFAISPDGRYLLSVGQISSHLSVYKIEKNTGHLQFIKRYSVGNNPSWIEIVELK